MRDVSPQNSFLGTGWRFPPEFGRRNRQAVMVSEEEDIRESLRILLSTAPGERVMYPDFGCGLNNLVFHCMTLGAQTDIKNRIARAVLMHEPRVTLNQVLVDAGSMQEGVVRIELIYTVRSTNNRSNMVYPFYLIEGTDISR